MAITITGRFSQAGRATVHIVVSQFISTWTTTVPAETITLPSLSAGTYDFYVNWGDGNSDHYTSWVGNSHEYASAGDHVVTITGTYTGIQFNNNSQATKLKNISDWGPVVIQADEGAFYGCDNLTITATEPPTFSDLGPRMFQDCSSLVTVPNMGSWDMSAVTTTQFMFAGATLFNQDISAWDVSLDANMGSMFDGAIAFDQDLGAWVITSLTDAPSMFNGVTLSTANYEALLSGWEAQVELASVTFDGGNSQYTFNSAAHIARTALIANSWTITDGGNLPVTEPAGGYAAWYNDTTIVGSAPVTAWNNDASASGGTSYDLDIVVGPDPSTMLKDSTLNGIDTVRTSANLATIYSPTGIITDTSTVALVFKLDHTEGLNQAIYSSSDGSPESFRISILDDPDKFTYRNTSFPGLLGPDADSAWHVVIIHSNNDATTNYTLDGGTTFTGDAGSSTKGGVSLFGWGAQNNLWMKGQIAEVLIYNSETSDADDALNLEYLQSRFGI